MATKDPWEWLSIVDIDGPFLSRSALKSMYPNGLAKPDSSVDDVNSTFVYEHTLWSKVWTARHNSKDAPDDFAWRDRWVAAVLRDLLQWGEHLNEQPDESLVVSSPDGNVTVRPWATLDVGNCPAALVVVVDRTEDLRIAGIDGWAADAIDRTAALLRATGVTVGLVTDGRWWGIVSASKDVTTASGVFDGLIWREERDSRDAFFALLGLVSLAGGAPEKRLSKLFSESVASAEAITEALGDQVRRAVELVLQAMSESHLRAIGDGEDSPLPGNSKEVYEASVSVLMRVIFLLFAEERGLLPQHQMYRESYAIANVRADLERQVQNDTEEALDHTWETWHRLLAASTAIFSGASFEDTRMPAYGGSLFDPARYPWLHTTNAQGQLTVRVSDRVMLQVLRAVQIANVGGEARQLSFRDLDVEQIGYVYEGLLGYTAKYTTEIVVGLHGKSGYEPQIALRELLKFADSSYTPTVFAKILTDYLEEYNPNAKPSSVRQITNALSMNDERSIANAKARLSYVLFDNSDNIEQLASLHGLIRVDLRDFPYVVPAGGLVMTESPQRANTGTHYTPRSLAEEVVLHALEPLVYSPGPLDTENRDDWVLKSSTEILNLKVADIAVGSGAFLVAAARYLAERLMEARTKEGFVSVENEDNRRWEIREIVARCLYGADINGMAVEMCKLSLWLVSMDPRKPFSFVDDRVFHGNSLLGVTSESQLRTQHIGPSRSRIIQRRILQIDVDGDLARAAQLRIELASGQVDDADRMRSTRVKTKLLADSREVTAKLRDVADGIIAAGLLAGGKPGPALDAQYERLADSLFLAYPKDGIGGDRTRLDLILSEGLTPTIDTGESRWKPLHWVIEAPDVIVEHGGFDAIIGNPPFLDGREIGNASGASVREWLVNQIANGVRGVADFVVYFFLRAWDLVNNDSGHLGLIATNSVAQGDSRKVGLEAMIHDGLKVRRAIQSRSWPARSANLEFAAVWGTSASIASDVRAVADGLRVPRISAMLEPEGRATGPAKQLSANRGGAFVGANINGLGFTMPPETGADMLNNNPTNADVLGPYLIGSDINSSPTGAASRWVVNFKDWEFEKIKRYPEPFEWIEENLKSYRLTLSKKPKLQKFWWIYERRAIALFDAIRDLDRVIVIALTSKTVMPMMVPARQIFSHAVGVFATDDFAELAFLSSMPHQTWAIKYGSGMRKDPRYTPSDVFETLPRPQLTDRMREIGGVLDSDRREIMLRRGIGLTELYNQVNDPSVLDDADVNRVREIHTDVNKSVMEAYGWTDIQLDHGFHTYRQMERFTVAPAARVEILDRLLEENHLRVEFETSRGKAANASTPNVDLGSAPEGAMF